MHGRPRRCLPKSVTVRRNLLPPDFFLSILLAAVVPNGAFSHYVTAAILAIPNNETAAMLVYKENPQGVELFSYASTFFISNKIA